MDASMVNLVSNMAMSMQSAQLQSAVGISMLKNSIDLGEQQATAVSEVLSSVSPSAMELSINPNVGGNIDISV
ncbi:MAG: YjfB family protein [Lachnospiraceae bacterium]|nr:YjfB family protein [Lachnospiraceae bacterium]